MDFKVRFSQVALIDFEEILAHSWAEHPNTTERFGKALLNHIYLLQSFPLIGSPVGDEPEVRLLVHTPILIYYRVNQHQGSVEILNLRHTSRRR